jgi:hypothetical protein
MVYIRVETYFPSENGKRFYVAFVTSTCFLHGSFSDDKDFIEHLMTKKSKELCSILHNIFEV